MSGFFGNRAFFVVQRDKDDTTLIAKRSQVTVYAQVMGVEGPEDDTAVLLSHVIDVAKE